MTYEAAAQTISEDVLAERLKRVIVPGAVQDDFAECYPDVIARLAQ